VTSKKIRKRIETKTTTGDAAACGKSFWKRGILYCRETGIDCKTTKDSAQCILNAKRCPQKYFIGIDTYCKITRVTCETTKKRVGVCNPSKQK
jgi:hypothetical protein